MTFLALALLAALPPPPQERDRPVFRVSTAAVQVDVFVGKDGKAVHGLAVNDFEVYDDGALRAVDSVTVAEIPLNVVLVLDTSESVAGETLSHLQRAADAFLLELSSVDRAALITFSHHLSLRSSLTSEMAPLRRALGELEGSGGTAWHDALFAALEMLEVVRDRPIVLLFTDGVDTYSWLREEETLALVSRSNAVVYAITRSESAVMPDRQTSWAREKFQRDREEKLRRTRLLLDVSRESGGRLIETVSSSELSEIFLEILAEMRTRYVLTFTPPPPVHEGWHDLEVRVKGAAKKVEVHARRGYYYQTPP